MKLAHALPDVNKFHDSDRMEDVSRTIAWDDLTGMKLNAGKVKEARSKELEYVKNTGVWTKIPRSQAQGKVLKVIKTKWIDINKRDD